jgi:hypothetical protein
VRSARCLAPDDTGGEHRVTFFIWDLRAPFGVGDSRIGREGRTFSRDLFAEPKAVPMKA